MKENFPRDFGRYRLLGLLGRGGMAEVYRAESQPIAGITRTVAIKRILADARDPQFQMMLLDEARIWVRLQHPNIVSVVDFGEIDDDWFLALELIEGMTASDLVRIGGPLPAAEGLCIAERLAKALAHAHTLEHEGRPLKIVHRDVKPANTLVSTSGEVKLTDFGIARAVDRISRTQAGLMKGSVPYVSPEQVRGEELDGRSDIFALGCTLHWLLTGRLLIDKGPIDAALTAIARGDIPAPDPSLPETVRQLIASLTAPDRRKRPATAAEVARQIRAMLTPATVEDAELLLGNRVRALRDPSEGAPVRAGLGTDAVEGGATDTTMPAGNITTPAGGPIPLAPSIETTAPPGPRPLPLAPSVERTNPFADALARLAKSVTRDRRKATIFAAAGITSLIVFVIGFRWVLCENATEQVATLTLTQDSLRSLHDAAAAQCRHCRSSAELRAARALAARRARIDDPRSAAELRFEPIERRVAELIRLDRGGWQNDPWTTRPTKPTHLDRCFEAIRGYNVRGSAVIAWPTASAGERCGLMLRASAALKRGDLTTADSLFLEALPSSGARLGRAAVAASEARPSTERIDDSIDMALRGLSGDEEIAGLWIPSSFRPLPGEPGRLTTALDDVPTIAAIIRGDLHARRGAWAAARREYQTAMDRGAEITDLVTRMADIDYATGEDGSMGLQLSKAEGSPPEISARGVLLLVLRDDVEKARSHLDEARSNLDPATIADLESAIARVERAAPAKRPYALGAWSENFAPTPKPTPKSGARVGWREAEIIRAKKLFDDGDVEGARRVFESVTIREPAFPDGHLGLGLALMRLRREPEACRHLRRYLVLAPKSTYSREIGDVVSRCKY